jgi:hypothetical protein
MDQFGRTYADVISAHPLKGMAKNVLQSFLWDVGEEVKENISNVVISCKHSIRIRLSRQGITDLVHVSGREQAIRVANLGHYIVGEMPAVAVNVSGDCFFLELFCVVFGENLRLVRMSRLTAKKHAAYADDVVDSVRLQTLVPTCFFDQTEPDRQI